MESRIAGISKKKYFAIKFTRYFSTIHRKGFATIKPANVLIHNRVKVADIQRRKAFSIQHGYILYICVRKCSEIFDGAIWTAVSRWMTRAIFDRNKWKDHVKIYKYFFPIYIILIAWSISVINFTFKNFNSIYFDNIIYVKYTKKIIYIIDRDIVSV